MNMIAAITLNLSSISPSKIPKISIPCAISSQFNSSSKPVSLIMHCTRRRCELYDMYKELVPYKAALSWQKSIVEERKSLVGLNEDHCDSLIILQHYPVYTMGTGSSESNLKFDVDDPPHPLIRQTGRGGEVTYHGPGQLVMYPIMNLRYHKMDLDWYLRALEEVVIRVLVSTFSLKASRIDGLTGVWVGNQKLAAIGVGGSRWITYHGISLNVSPDLSPFERVIPCGIRDRQVGSVKMLLCRSQSSGESLSSSVYHGDDYQLLDLAHGALIKEFSEVFQVEIYHQPVPISKCRENVLEL